MSCQKFAVFVCILFISSIILFPGIPGREVSQEKREMGVSLYNNSETITVPVVGTTRAVWLTTTWVKVGGWVYNNGGGPVTAMGVCWSLSPHPTLADSFTNDGTGGGIYASFMRGLTHNTLYYFRAYATNSAGTGYGDDMTVTTLKEFSGPPPTVLTLEVSDVTHGSATCGGNVISEGGEAVTVRGVCWGTHGGINIDYYRSSDGSGPGVYSSKLVGLSANTTYYVRAYAANPVDFGYGAVISFRTKDYPPLQPPTVSTAEVLDVTTTTAVCGGNVTEEGTGWVYCRGVCWSTTWHPTISDARTYDGWGLGIFTSRLSGLAPGTYYYVRAYAISAVGVSYGKQVTFSTEALKIPSITTAAVSEITPSTAVCGGTVTADGGAEVTARGVCWSTKLDPDITGFHTVDGSGTGVFSSAVTGLEPDTAYFVRAYAVNAVGTAYGEPVSFTTEPAPVQLPTVSTAAVSDVTSYTASCGGKVKKDGGAEVTARGVCWSTSPYPNINGNHTVDGSGTGIFTSAITGLEPDTSYYVRAYAENSAGTAYGKQRQFTSVGLPAVSVKITNPTNGGTVAGIVAIEADVAVTGTVPQTVDRVEFYIDGELVKTDTRKPYKYRWDTRTDNDGIYVLRVKAFGSAGDRGEDEISVTVKNESGGSPHILLERGKLYFAAVVGPGDTYQSGPQYFGVANGGAGVLRWTVTASESWIKISSLGGLGDETVTVSVDPGGMAVGRYSGTITIFAANADNSPQAVTVFLEVKEAAGDYDPFGKFEAPGEGDILGGSVPLSGWALDDIGVEHVKIYRDPVPPEPPTGPIFVGKAIFVEGARPDIENIYPTYPNNRKAGWSYVLLADLLPFSRDGRIVLSVFACDGGGNEAVLGSKAIYVLAERSKPFGAIEMPAEGGTASGSNYRTWGWALTPLPDTIPKDGSTITVWLDGVALPGHPVYNLYRADIAEAYPDYNNSDGAVGYYLLDTTEYADGIHRITWSVTDDAGNTAALGSRRFIIDNGGTGKANL